MCPAFSDAAVLEHGNGVGVNNCRESVRYDYGRSPLANPFQGVLNPMFGMRVQRACSLV